MVDMPPAEGDDVPSVEMVDEAITLSVLDAIQQLIDERKEMERFMEEKCAGLVELREQVRAEGTTAGEELRQQIDALRRERDAALTQVDTLTRELRRVKLGEQLAADELEQAKQQAEQQRRHSAEFQRLLDTLREQLAREMQEHRAATERYTLLEKEHAEMKDLLQGLEQAEAELRQEQEAVRKERERLQGSSSGKFTAVMPASSSPNISIGPGDQKFLNFMCKHCGAKLQAKEHLAGLVTRCSQCTKMAPVPKP